MQNDWMCSMWGRARKKKPAHPCWHVQRLITVAAVSTDVGLRGSCQSVCVCVRKYARVCVRDSVWQWSEGYLVMTAADTMDPFLYLSIQCSRSPPSHPSSCRSSSFFFKLFPPCSSYLLLSQYFTFSWSVARCTPVVICVCVSNKWMLQPIQFILFIPEMRPPIISFLW